MSDEEPQFFALPDRDTMAAKLSEINPDPHTEAYFHSRLLAHAGESVTAIGYVLTYTLVVSDYVNSRGLGHSVMANLEVATHIYARALVPEGPMLDQVLCVIAEMGLPH